MNAGDQTSSAPIQIPTAIPKRWVLAGNPHGVFGERRRVEDPATPTPATSPVDTSDFPHGEEPQSGSGSAMEVEVELRS